MEFIENVKITTDDFFYDLITGGYIKPEKLLKNKEDINLVLDAVEIIKKFKYSAEYNDIINHI